MTNKDWIKIWLRERDEVTKTLLRERDEVAKTYDVEAFKAFYRKWKARGLYQLPLPEDDEVIERTMRKMVCNMKTCRTCDHMQRSVCGPGDIYHGIGCFGFGISKSEDIHKEACGDYEEATDGEAWRTSDAAVKEWIGYEW